MRRLPLLLVVIGVVVFGLSSAAAAPGPPPAGLTGISLAGQVGLSWSASPGATGYSVYRGTTATSITTQVTPAGGVAGTSFTDSSVVNNTTYYYAVRSITGGTESANSLTVQTRPIARACSTGNTVVLENCYPGTTPWNVRNTATIAAGGIEGFGTSPSIDKGQSVDLKVNSDDAATFRIEIYRMGYYGGAGARLFSTIRGVPGTRQPSCISDDNTGLLDCSNWSVSATLTTTTAWPSGVFMLRLVREDTGTDNQILLTVRDDARPSQLLYGVADTNYQAYNNYGGKSLYDFNSIGNATVAGTPRAVKVSFDRPYEEPRSGLRDWYTRNEAATVYWLEREGYDVAYTSNYDLEQNGSRLLGHKAYISPAHDEYWSAGMRSSLKTARDAGVNLFFTGSNEIYWKIRFENSPISSKSNRVEVTYKSTQSGGPDPSGIPTGTWRDPAGANLPENQLTGEMYVGDNDTQYFPLVINATQGADRIYRYTGLDAQPPGSSTTIGQNLVGWEWDARAANGFEPAGVKTLSSSPVTGELIQNNGRNTIPGSTSTTMVKYTAPSGALVVTTGTNHWNRGLALNGEGVGEPDTRIQQTTTNILEDMGAVPQTPAADITLDTSAGRPAAPSGAAAGATGTDSVQVTWNPVAGASGYNVYRSLSPRDGGQPLGALANGALITGTSFTDTGLNSATTYYYVVTTVVNGVQSLASNEATTTTAASAGQPTRINAGGAQVTTLSGAVFRADALFTGGSTFSAGTRAIAGTSDPALYQDERWGQFSYAIPVTPGTYDVRFHFVELYYGTAVTGGAGKRVFGMDIVDTPANPDLANIDVYAAVGKNTALIKTVPDVTVTDGTLNIRSVYGSADDPELAAVEVIPKSVAAPPPTVVDTLPLAGATGASRLAHPSATFSRAMTAASITSSSFTLTPAGGAAVPATVSYDATNLQATLVPTSALAFSTTYTARLATTVTAADGTPLASAVTWTFTTQDPVPPQVTSTFPLDQATAVSPSARPRATFSRSLDPTTVTASSFTLTGPGGAAVPATVSYDDSTRSATLTPNAALAFSTSYTATVKTSVKAVDGVALAAPVSWSFTTSPAPPPPPTVSGQAPAPGATGVSRTTGVDVTFSRDLDPTSLNTSSFTLTGPSGLVPAAVTYDAATRTGHLVPTAALAFSGSYTARLETAVHATDGTPLTSAVSWTFTTVDPPPAPTVSSKSPSAGASYVSRAAVVTAGFSRAMDPTTLTASSFTLSAGANPPVAATVTYDSATNTAKLTPSAPLDGGLDYTATLSTAVQAADGIALASAVSWTFSTAACPCQLFSPVLTPDFIGLSTQDGRSGAGPWSYELGTKITVDEPTDLNAIRFYKSDGETGTHVGRVWTTSGVQLAQVTFTGESASGWQQQSLAQPLALQPGVTYVISVNANAFFSVTSGSLATRIVSGPLSTVTDGANGVYGLSASTFPTLSYNTSNYFVDVSVAPTGDPVPPGVTGQSPAGGATGVARTSSVVAAFSRSLVPSTVNAQTFTLTGPSGAVPATVTYDDTTRTATLTPTGNLAYSTAYTASLASSIRALDGKALGAPVTWSFTVADPVRPQVTSVVPADGASDIGAAVKPRATFSKSLDPTTITASTFTLTGPGGAVPATVAYDDTTRTATMTPNAALTAGATYTARLDGAIAATDSATLGSPTTWQFTVSAPQPPPTITSTAPAAGATFAARTGAVSATFSRSMDPATLTSSSFTLAPAAGGAAVAATVTYNSVTRTASLQPTATLAASTDYTARVDATVKAADGTALAAPVTWTFTTAACPCQLFSPLLVPAVGGLPTQDGRTGAGPWSYEFGVKVTVDVATDLNAIRFYKTAGETGTHIGRLWTSSGVLLAQTTFTGETASGWQQQAFASAPILQPGAVYVLSVNANSFFSVTGAGLAAPITAGPLSTVADGANGVFGSSAGTFPTGSYNSSNYFIDASVVPDGDPAPPSVTAQSPAGGATGVARSTAVTATFSRAIDPTTLTSTSFKLTGPSGTVAASVAYNATTRTATLTPSAALAFSTSYTATLSTAIRGTDGKPLANAVTWSFTTVDPVRPQLVSTVPVDGATDIGSGVKPRATFSRSLDPTTVNSTTFTLTGPAGAVAATVAYDDSTTSATLTPNVALTAGATYTARLAATIAATDGATLGVTQSWSFTVAAPSPFDVSGVSPAAGATGIQRDTTVLVTFNRSADPSTLTSATLRVKDASGTVVPASITYDAASRTATIKPNAWLNASATYTVEATTGAKAADGTALAGVRTSTFTTTTCPCSLFAATAAPVAAGNPTSDGRSGAGPFSYELGMKFTVSRTATLIGVRYFKDPLETGTHIGKLWSASGTSLGTVTFSGESASGWQVALFSTPLTLTAGTTYVVSVNANAYFGVTTSGLATQLTSAPISSVVGGNGVFGASAGTFPINSYSSSNYFVDVVVR